MTDPNTYPHRYHTVTIDLWALHHGVPASVALWCKTCGVSLMSESQLAHMNAHIPERLRKVNA